MCCPAGNASLDSAREGGVMHTGDISAVPEQVSTPDTAGRSLLIVDDEDASVELISRVFRRQFAVWHARNGTDGLALARRQRPTVIITDQRMPEMDGVELLAHIKAELPESVRILMTGDADRHTLLEAINAAHVHHCLEKPVQTLNLRTVVDALVRAAELARERDSLAAHLERVNAELLLYKQNLERWVEERTQHLKTSNQRLQELAIRDELTHLFNRRHLLEHLKLEVARACRYKREFSLLFLDVDDFKHINDRWGHGVGDAVLRRIAGMFLHSEVGLRGSDVAARYGGEEFCVVLPETGCSGGAIKAERLREQIGGSNWDAVQGAALDAVTVSVGLATFPHVGQSVEALLAAADGALYEAKRAGKNCVRVAAPVRT